MKVNIEGVQASITSRMKSAVVFSLRELCIKNNWFTEGTNTQYSKMFDYAANALVRQSQGEQSGIDELACIIWVCSESNDGLADIDSIKAKLRSWAVEFLLDTHNG